MSVLSYRKDIDGLRAIAILPVVLFHAFPNFVPGGFIGVDVFFVISGYLITSILLKEHLENQFSLKQFYARRIRRIFPALGVVLLACLLYGWMILTPEELQKLGKYVAGGTVFVANILFWKDAGYFDPAADTKPVLHLWSLGIEEQFYIVFPLIVLLIRKFWLTNHEKFIWVIQKTFIVLILVSFSYSLFLISSNSVAAFYSPLARAWELGVGAFLAVMHLKKGHGVSNCNHQNYLSVIGLCLLLLGFGLINEVRAFPGFWALLPVLGTAFLLHTPNSWINQKLLSQKIIVGIGLISYSWYLWHWPLLSFSRIIHAEQAPILVRLLLVLLSLMLAYLSYRFIEKPIRQLRSRYIISYLLIGLISIGIIGQVINKSKGFPQRQFQLLNADPSSLKMGSDRQLLIPACGVLEFEREYLQTCYSNKEKLDIVVWGDSKAEALFYGLARESNLGIGVIGNMPPLMGNDPSLDKKSQTRIRIFKEAIERQDTVKTVFIVTALRTMYGVSELYERDQLESSKVIEQRFESLKESINFLLEKNKRVVIIKDHPAFPDPKSCISGGMTQSDLLNKIFFRKENLRCTLSYEQYKHDSGPYHEMMERLNKQYPQVQIFDLAESLCDKKTNNCPMYESGQFLYSYGDHLSDYASSKLARQLLPLINQ